MRDHHPLGSARRARGIDQVSGTVRVGGNARPPGYGLDVLGQAHQLHVGGETVGQRPRGHHDGRPGVSQDFPQPARRRRRVQRQVGGPGFEDADQRPQPVRRAFQKDAHEGPGPGARLCSCLAKPRACWLRAAYVSVARSQTAAAASGERATCCRMRSRTVPASPARKTGPRLHRKSCSVSSPEASGIPASGTVGWLARFLRVGLQPGELPPARSCR